MKQRYFLQEMKKSGFPYYEIIDTADGCDVVYFTFDHADALEKLKELEKAVALMEATQANFKTRLFPERCY